MNEKEMNLQLKKYLQELCLPNIRDSYSETAKQAAKESMSYEAYLYELVQQQCSIRRQNRIERRLKESKIPYEKNMETFSLQRMPKKVVQQIQTLIEGSFLKRKENILAFGNPGSGKTHLLCAIGQELIKQEKNILFMPCSLLVQDLLIAKRELKLSRIIKKLAKFEALIIDDLGYVKQDKDEMEVLFTLLAERYERGSVMLTSNLAFSKWETIFKDPMVTAAAIDRLVHHSVILELNISSYRMDEANKKKVN